MVQHEDTKGSRDRRFGVALLAICCGATLATLLLASPRPIVPTQLPVLELDARAERGALARDAALVLRAPTGDDVTALWADFLEEGRAELLPRTDFAAAERRGRRLKSGTQILLKRVGEEGLFALRMRAVQGMLVALRGDLGDADEARGLLGRFESHLHTYGLLDASGRFAAPELCVRAMYKVRWNMVHHLPQQAGLEPIEQQAFHGWIALHAGTVPSPRRAEAARAFYRAGGRRSAQALATWLYHGGDARAAFELMGRAHAQDRALFTRNYELGIMGDALP